MPLNTAQRELVQSAISYFLDFTMEPLQFKYEVCRITEAVVMPVDDSHVYAMLGKCLRRPTECLNRLEQLQTAGVSVAEVQRYILNVITHKINKVADKLGIEPLDLVWRRASMVNFLQIDQHQFRFESERIAADSGQHPYELVSPGEHKIYRAVIMPDDLTGMLCVQVTLLYPEGLVLEDAGLITITEMPRFNSERAQDSFISQSRDEAKRMAEFAVAQQVLHYLISEGCIILEEDETVHITPGLARLLTHRFYVEELSKLAFDWRLIANINIMQAEKLLNLSIIDLIKRKLCDITTAKMLMRATIAVIATPFYYAQITNDLLKLDELRRLSTETCKNLIFPAVIHLLTKKVIVLEQVALLTPHAKSLLADPFYFDNLMRGSLSWSMLCSLSEKQCAILSCPAAVKLIAQEVLSLDGVKDLSEEQLTVFSHPTIQSWLATRKMTVAEVMTLNTVQLGEGSQDLRLFSLSSYIYGYRLYQLHKGHPLIVHGVTDSASLIHQDMQDAAHRGELNHFKLQTVAIRKLLSAVSRSITTEWRDLWQEMPAIYARVHRIIDEAETALRGRDDDGWYQGWQEVLRRIIQVAGEEVARLTSPEMLSSADDVRGKRVRYVPTVFRPAMADSYASLGARKVFCERLCALEQFREPEPEVRIHVKRSATG